MSTRGSRCFYSSGLSGRSGAINDGVQVLIVDDGVVGSSRSLGFLRYISGELKKEEREDEQQYMRSILPSL
jgi:hypothetical protein